MKDAVLDPASQVLQLEAELADLELLYETAIAHGEAVEEELADRNDALRRTQERLAGEFADASHYIQTLLPTERTSAPQIDWRYEPSSELSGDTLGHFEIAPGHVAFYVIDVCGHGVGAALLSVSLANQMRAWSFRVATPSDPASVLTELNDAFPMEKHGNRFFTIWYGVHDATSGTLRYASAGAPPALLLSDSGTRLLGAPALPLGCVPELSILAHEMAVEQGDRLLVFSDGVYEVDGADGRQIGIDAFCTRATQNDDPDTLFDWVCTQGTAGALPDDFTLLRVRF